MGDKFLVPISRIYRGPPIPSCRLVNMVIDTLVSLYLFVCNKTSLQQETYISKTFVNFEFFLPTNK
jgi:hypothetical protein